MALNVEGKRHRKLREDCQAVSEVVGQVLMIAIVVLAFSSIAVVIFSDIVANPPHTPHTDLSEKINTNDDTIKIIHSGGEAIDLKAIKIILSVKGQSVPFDMSYYNKPNSTVKVWHFDGNLSNDNALMLGDCIEINTSQSNISLRNDTIDMFFVHTPSQQVIQKVMLHSGN